MRRSIPARGSSGTAAKALLNALLLSLAAGSSSAQSMDTPWRLRIMDMKHTVKATLTIRFTAEVAESCMHGNWRRIIVEAKSTSDPGFFPLHDGLAYERDGGMLTLGRTKVCDDYAFLTGKSNAKHIRGTYYFSTIGHSKQLGFFTLTKI